MNFLGTEWTFKLSEQYFVSEKTTTIKLVP